MAGGVVPCEPAEYVYGAVNGVDAGWGDAKSSEAGWLVSGGRLNYGLKLRARGETGRRTTLRW